MRLCTLLILTLVLNTTGSFGYSILTHEAIIDAAWDKNIAPLLKQKYPLATTEQMKEARAYAYGGAVAPDMGYYPRGAKLFTNLVHYVRSGDFVTALIDEAGSLNEYAFALGFLAHYYADNFGHPIGINRSVPILFPKLRTKYGDTVTYSEHPVSHVRTELSFDVLQTARGNYSAAAYHDYIGFKVSEPVLKRAFVKTYGLEIEDIFKDFPKAVNTFRWSVTEVFPQLTRTAWDGKKEDILKTTPAATRGSYIYRISRADYINEFGKDYEKPNFFTRIVVVVMRFLPHVGPLKKLKIVVPGPEAEKLFVQSFDTVVVHYIHSLSNINGLLTDKDFDTGKNTVAGEYDMADDTYAELLLTLREKNFNKVSPALKNDIIHFYSGSHAHVAQQRDPEKSGEIQTALEQLRNNK